VRLFLDLSMCFSDQERSMMPLDIHLVWLFLFSLVDLTSFEVWTHKRKVGMQFMEWNVLITLIF
jgi:hypothetical protein